jgi:hypothetical protein
VRPTARQFEAAYASALAAHLEAGGESTLRAAYELGRDAVVGELSVLDVAGAYHRALTDALRRARDREDVVRTTRAAGEFLVESLSAYEMVQRGLRETREAAVAERRQSAMLRQLTSLLADPSLALGRADSLAEALRLVAEEARELTGARCCVATAALGGGRALTEVAVDLETEVDPATLARPDELARRHALVQAADGPVRQTSEAARSAPALAGVRAEGGRPLRGWIAAPLTFLDTRHFGCLEVFDSETGEFTELDEAMLDHLARLASAALERAHVYRPRR